MTRACTPETTTPIITTTLAPSCADFAKCSQKELEIVFIVEVASDHSILDVLDQLSDVSSHLVNSRLSLFMNDLVLMISLEQEVFLTELAKLKADSTAIKAGIMDWALVEQKAKIMKDPSADISKLIPQDTDGDYDDSYDSSYADSSYQNPTKQPVVEPIGKENLSAFRQRDPVFVALPSVGGVKPESSVGDEIQLMVFEIGATLKPFMSQHIIMDTLKDFACTFIESICADPTTVPTTTVEPNLSCLKMTPPDHGSICRTEFDKNSELDIIALIEATDATHVRGIINDILTLVRTINNNNGDAVRLTIIINEKLVVLSMTEVEIRDNLDFIKNFVFTPSNAEDSIFDWENMLHTLAHFIGGDKTLFFEPVDWNSQSMYGYDGLSAKSAAYNSDYGSDIYGTYGNGDDNGYGNVGDTSYNYNYRKRRSTEESLPLGEQNFNDFVKRAKYVIALPQPDGVGPRGQSGTPLTDLQSLSKLMIDQEVKNGKEFIKFTWYEYGRVFDQITNSAHVILELGANEITCKAVEYICEHARNYQPVIPDPLVLDEPPICLGGKVNLVLLVDSEFRRADQLAQFSTLFESSYPSLRGSNVRIIEYGKYFIFDGMPVNNLKEAIEAADYLFTTIDGSGIGAIIAFNSRDIPPELVRSASQSRTNSLPDLHLVELEMTDRRNLESFLGKVSADRKVTGYTIDKYDADEFEKTFESLNQAICEVAGGKFPDTAGQCTSSRIGENSNF